MSVLSRVTSCPSLSRSEELLGTSDINQESPEQATTLGHPGAELEAVSWGKGWCGSVFGFPGLVQPLCYQGMVLFTFTEEGLGLGCEKGQDFWGG